MNNTNEINLVISGDSGDGIQFLGNSLAVLVANAGGYVQTLANYPAEIRAPKNTISGVSSIYLRFSSEPIYSTKIKADVAVLFNIAAKIKNANYIDVKSLLIIDKDGFSAKELKVFDLEDKSISTDKTIALDIFNLMKIGLNDKNLSFGYLKKNKNIYILGMLTALLKLPFADVSNLLKNKFLDYDNYINIAKLGFLANNKIELTYQKFIKLDKREKNTIISGSKAIAETLIKIANFHDQKIFLGGYPITPASPILTILAKKPEQIMFFQAEDEISAIGAAIGASYGGTLAASVSSGPGIDLKTEMLGLAIMAELPILVFNIQRSGPSTGMPTRTEQTDLLSMVYGRHGESYLPVFALSSIQGISSVINLAFKLSIKYSTPIIILGDAYLAIRSQRILSSHISDTIDRENIKYPKRKKLPGMLGCEHTIGGLERDNSGKISYDPLNHQLKTDYRYMKLEKLAQDFPKLIIKDYTGKIVRTTHDVSNKYLILNWGSNIGIIIEAMMKMAESSIHLLDLNYIYPIHPQLKGILKRYKKIIIPELNYQQFYKLLLAENVTTKKQLLSLNKVTGEPFSVEEIVKKINKLIYMENN